MGKDRLLDFAAIDFETANKYRGSICSVGIVVVRGGEITGSAHRLVCPRPNFYNWFTTRIHGMTQADTDEAPEFPEVWAGLEPMIEGLPLVAHNSPFEEGCLRAIFSLYEMVYPGYRFHCTCRAARRAFPQLPNHKLNTVAAHVGFELIDHHHALADAEACAAIALRIL